MGEKAREGYRIGDYNASGPPWGVVIGLVVLVLAIGFPDAWTAPFFSDDYIFLDKVRGSAFAPLWSAHRLAYGYYRPWSRELHYWVLYHLFGLRVGPYHAVSLALIVGILVQYFVLLRRMVGGRSAALAVCGVLGLAAWGIPARWAPAAQDLWMMLFALVSLDMFVQGRTLWSAVALAMGLLSKETAAVVPLIAYTYARIVERRTTGAALGRVWLLAVVAAAWFALHPSLGGRFWLVQGVGLPSRMFQSPLVALVRSPLAVLNLDLRPAPAIPWKQALLAAVPLTVVLFGFALWVVLWKGLRTRGSEGDAPAAVYDVSPRVYMVAFGIGWALFAWLPLALPNLIWQPYYVLFGALGAWLAIVVALSRARWFLVLLIAGVALISVARTETEAQEWSNEPLQRFGRRFMAHTESYLRTNHPTLPPYSRLYFAMLPRGIVFLTGHDDAPALRVWYGPTVQGSFWSSYATRSPADSAGPDLFFLYDSAAGWSELRKGPEDVEASRRGNPRWGRDHERLALTLAAADDILGATIEYEKLATAYPDSASYPTLAGMGREALGDSATAHAWYVKAAALPGADNAVRERAAGMLGGGRDAR